MGFHCLFFFNDTATTEIYTLSLHDALPILILALAGGAAGALVASWGVHLLVAAAPPEGPRIADIRDRKSTRLNSSHGYISYAVFCLKKKNMGHHVPPLLRQD